MLPRLLAILLILLLAGSMASAGGYTNPFDDPDVPDWSDEKVLEYVQHPEAQVREAACREILRRWNQEKLIAYLKKPGNWRWGVEILYAGAWPDGGGDVADYMLTGDGFTDSQCEDAIALVAARGGVPDGDRYAGRIGTRVRDLWFDDWMRRIPRSVFFTGTIDFICKRSWCRERLYKDGAGGWCRVWGAYTLSDGSWYRPWQLKEYRQVVQILCGEPTDEERLRTNEFLLYLKKAVATGQNPCDVEMRSQSQTFADLLPSTITISGVGQIAYAELVAVVMNRPDWMPAITKRLQATVRKVSQPKPSPDGKSVVFVDIVTHYDASSPMISWLAKAGSHDIEGVKAGLWEYWRRDWRGYREYAWHEDLWRRHPWLTKIRLDEGFAAWYEGACKKFDDVAPDTAFLKGEWQ